MAGAGNPINRQRATAASADRDGGGRTAGFRREFIGFNRARHAVLEAAIYSTRLHLLPRAFVESEFARLQTIVDKTAGPSELEAMALLVDYLRSAPTAVSTHA